MSINCLYDYKDRNKIVQRQRKRKKLTFNIREHDREKNLSKEEKKDNNLLHINEKCVYLH